MDAMVLKGIVKRIPRLVARIASIHVLRLCIIALVLALGANVAAAQQVTLSMPDTVVNPGASVSIPIRVTGFNNVGSFTFRITFDKTVLTYAGLANTPSSVSSSSVATANTNGWVDITWYSLTPLNIGTGKLMDILFTFGSGSSALTFVTPSSITDAMGNSFVPPTTFANGRVRSPGGNPPPIAPTLASPLTGSTDQPTSLTLSWNPSSGATSYRLQISINDPSFGAIFLDDATLTSTSRVVVSLSSSQTYYWRVSAANSAGSGAFSSSWLFQTVSLPPPPVPTLLMPTDGVTAQPLMITLQWNPSSGATSYELQVATDAGFGSSTIVVDNSGTELSKLVGPFSGSSTYFWRVAATGVGGTSEFSSSRSFTTQPGPPSIPTLSSPANGATGQATTLYLGWYPSSGAATYTLQVSTASDFSTTIVNDPAVTTTNRQITGLLNSTTYYWKVSATNGSGTSLYSSVWHFTTIPVPPSAPTLNSPSDGATGIDVNPTLSWFASSGATTYRVQVSTASDFSSPIVDDATLTSTSKPVSGLTASTLYYWHVSASNAGGASAFSASRQFTTGVGLLPPVLTIPPDGATGVAPAAVDLVWVTVTGATSYHVQIASDAGFSSLVYDAPSVSTWHVQVTSLLNNMTYYWHVSASAGSNTTAYSATRSFSTTAGPPSTPVLPSPPDGSIGIPTSLSLTWSASAGATKYRVQLSTASSFSTTIVDDSTLTSPSRQVSGLITGTTYYWHASATNSNGTSAWSSTWSFTAGGATPTAPTLLSPANGATNQSTNITFSWSPSIGATSYHLQVAYDQNCTNIVSGGDFPNVTTTSQGFSGFLPSTKYYWRVNASNAGGSSSYSATWNFTTGTTATSLSIPDTVAIPGGSLSVPINVTGFYDVGSFTLQIVFDKNVLTFNSIANAPSGASATDASTANANGRIDITWYSLTAFNLGAGKLMDLQFTYKGGTSALSFTGRRASDITDSHGGNVTASYTDGRVRDASSVTPSAPTLMSPADIATNQLKNLTLSWSSSVGTTSYRLQVSTVSNFATTVYDQSGLTGTSVTMSTLLNGTTYYWQVSATNTAGTSAYSASRSFTTIIAAPAVPTLISPPNGATGIVIYPNLTWNASAGASTYRVQVSTDSTFGTYFVDDSTLTGTVKPIGPLASNVKYFWHVSATNIGGISQYSAVWSFTAVVPIPAVPTLATPATGATNVAINPTLTWNAATGAATYRVQVATDSNFTAIILNDSTLTATQRAVGPLLNSVKYYWRVNAKNAGGTSQYSTVWSFTTIIAVPGVTTLIAPASGTGNNAISPTLTWNATATATTYRVQVATDSNFTSIVLTDSTLTATQRAVGPLLNNVKYYWRVNASNVGGWGAYSTVWNFTTIVATPSVPTLATPLNGATSVATSPTLTWNAVTGATYYHLQVSANTAFTTPVLDKDSITAPTYAVPGLVAGTQYYWRVLAWNAGGTSAYATAFTFSTLIATPGLPTLASPVNGATNVSIAPTLTWNAVAVSAFYHLQVSTTPAFGTFVLDKDSITATSYALSGLNNASQYYWRVLAWNLGGSSGYGAAWTFTTIMAAPGVPTLIMPANALTNVSIAPTLAWSPVAGAAYYHLQISTSATFTPIVVDMDNLTANSVGVTGLANASQYYWHVLASNVGGVSAYSTAWSFTTIVAIPGVPSLVSPLNGSTGLPLTQTLSWTASSGATTYKLQVATDSLFASIVLNDSTLTTTQRQVGPLPYGTKHFWRVNATNVGGPSLYSTVWSFTTIVAAPTTPTLLLPVDGARNVPVTVSLTWIPSTGATSYRIQVASNPSFSIIVLDDSIVTTPSRSVGPLVNNALYYWRVRAKNDGGITAFSDPWAFTTIVALPAIPTLVAPVDSEKNVSLSPTLRWNLADGAASYHLQVSTTPAFTTTIVDDTTLTGTQSTIGSIDLAKTYYWRVSAKNIAGYSAYSATRSFKTILTTSVEQIEGAVPKEYALTQNYPNPFNPTTTIQYDIPASGPVSLKLYTILGAQVFTLVDQHQEPGRYLVKVNAQSLPSGIYLYQLRAGSFVQTKRMILLK